MKNNKTRIKENSSDQLEREDWMQDKADPRIIYDWKGTIAKCDTIRGYYADKENAQKIVKALNMHQELLDTLKEFIEVCPCKNGCKKNDMTCVTQKAKSLIKQAEQK